MTSSTRHSAERGPRHTISTSIRSTSTLAHSQRSYSTQNAHVYVSWSRCCYGSLEAPLKRILGLFELENLVHRAILDSSYVPQRTIARLSGGVINQDYAEGRNKGCMSPTQSRVLKGFAYDVRHIINPMIPASFTPELRHLSMVDKRARLLIPNSYSPLHVSRDGWHDCRATYQRCTVLLAPEAYCAIST